MGLSELLTKDRCSLCGHASFERLRAYPGFDGIDLAKCESCGLMQAHPLPTPETLSEYYRSEFGSDPTCGFQMSDASEKGFRLRAEMQFDFIRRTASLPERGRVLDVGCHAASLLSLFKKRGWDVTGVDPNPRSRYGEKWYGIRVLERMFEPEMFEKGSFDMILHSHVLEHMRDPGAQLREFHRLLKPGGSVFLEVPNESIQKVMDLSVMPHLFFFTAETLSRLSRESGFEVVATRVFGIGRRRGSWLRWLALRWKARYDASGRVNLLTMAPFFGKLSRQDRYFKEAHPDAAMLRLLLSKPGGRK